MTTKLRFRLDSATAGEVQALSGELFKRTFWARKDPARPLRGPRLLLHWWALGHDPARALRCPRCEGRQMLAIHRVGYIEERSCPSCSGRGWSWPSERGDR